MFTIYTVVREFAGQFDRIQRNAITSWTMLEPRPQIILFGKGEPRAEEAARDLGIPLRRVRRNKWGTPLLRSAMNRAHLMAKYDVCCYVNADIIILQDFISALEATKEMFQEFLLSARRWDFDPHLLIPAGAWNINRLHQWVRQEGELHRPTGVDVFCYRGVEWDEIPDLAIGRSAWDNWLVGWAVIHGVPFVDATDVSTIVHQNHTMRLVGEERVNDPERLHNQALVYDSLGTRHRYGFDVAAWKFDAGEDYQCIVPTHFGKSRRLHE